MRGLAVSLLCAVHPVHSVPSSDFLVIHIGDEGGAGQYESRFLDEIPPEALTEPEAYLVLRRVPFTAFPDAKDDPDPRMRIAALSDDSYIGIAPVSLRQWRQVTGEDVPGEEISSEEWNRFLDRLNERTGLLHLHAATDHQWEALLRNGPEMAEAWGIDISEKGERVGGPGILRPHQMAELSKLPKPIEMGEPWWPRGYSPPSVVIVADFIVRRDGSVGEVVIVEGNDKTLDQAVLRALRGSRFAPGEVNGVPVDVRGRIRIPIRRIEQADEATAPETDRPIRRRRR